LVSLPLVMTTGIIRMKFRNEIHGQLINNPGSC